MWNNAEHLEAYLAIPSMGAVLHTLNLRLDPAQLGYIAYHAGDDVVIVDATLMPAAGQVLPQASRRSGTSSLREPGAPSACSRPRRDAGRSPLKA